MKIKHDMKISVKPKENKAGLYVAITALGIITLACLNVDIVAEEYEPIKPAVEDYQELNKDLKGPQYCVSPQGYICYIEGVYFDSHTMAIEGSYNDYTEAYIYKYDFNVYTDDQGYDREVETGNYLITIPAFYATEYGYERGDEVLIQTSDGQFFPCTIFDFMAGGDGSHISFVASGIPYGQGYEARIVGDIKYQEIGE